MNERDAENLLRSARLEPAPERLKAPDPAAEEESRSGPSIPDSRRGRQERFIPVAAAAGVVVGVAVLIAMALRGSAPSDDSVAPARSEAVLTFDADRADGPPAGFEFTACRGADPGRWVVREGNGGKVVAQADGRAQERYASAVLADSSFRNLRLSARVRNLSGYQRAGLAWRVQDENNYYCAGLNPTYPGVRLDRVVDGRRIIMAQRHAPLRSGAWHSLAVEHRGHTLLVFVDGVRLLKVRDETFLEGGKVGFWIKDDTVAEFDDLKVEELR